MSAPRALVLTAGLGTRLRPLTYLRAKAAVPINGETLARRAVRWLASQGITDLVLNLHHHPESITASVGDGADLGARVRYSWEQPLLGSAGGPRHALPLLIDPAESDEPPSDPNPPPTPQSGSGAASPQLALLPQRAEAGGLSSSSTETPSRTSTWRPCRAVMSRAERS
jgi:hypothetical protein